MEGFPMPLDAQNRPGQRAGVVAKLHRRVPMPDSRNSVI
jgi:hypothetical protein